MVQVIQISGFLGSGKTSTIIGLAKLLYSKSGKKIAIIVNEIGDVDVDGEFVRSAGLLSKKLLGGCICCSLGADLVSTMKAVIDEYNPEIMFVEPTGVALPSQVKKFFVQATYILPNLQFSPVITLVDGTRFNFLLKEYRTFFTKQMRDAEILAITKVDKVDKKFSLPLIVSALKDTHPQAKILGISIVSGEGLDQLLEMAMVAKSYSFSAAAVAPVQQAASASDDSVEGAGVGSADFSGRLFFDKQVGETEVKAILAELLTTIGSRCSGRAGNLIGHVKAFVNVGKSGMKASLVDLSTGVEFSGNLPQGIAEMDMSLFGALNKCDSAFLQETMNEAMDEVKRRYNLRIESKPHSGHHPDL